MGEAAKLIFGYPVMIDGFALNSGDLPLPQLGLLDEVAKTVNALRYFNNDGMVFLWGETDSSGPSGANTALGARRAEAVAAYLRRAGVPAAAIQTLSLGPTFASRTSRRDAASRRVEIRFQEPPPPPAPTPRGAPTAVRPQLRLDLLPRSSVSGPIQFPPFTLTPTPNTGTQYGWPGLFKDENRQTWCQNIATSHYHFGWDRRDGERFGGAMFSNTGGRNSGTVYGSAGPGHRAAQLDDLQSADATLQLAVDFISANCYGRVCSSLCM